MISLFMAGCVGLVAGTIITFSFGGIMSSWEEGYETARKTYGDWSKGFHDGFHSGFKHGEEYAKEYEQKKGEASE